MLSFDPNDVMKLSVVGQIVLFIYGMSQSQGETLKWDDAHINCEVLRLLAEFTFPTFFSRRPLSSCTMERDDAGANQVCNPPMVHSLAWSPSGRLLAAGLGDGTIGILKVDNRRLNLVSRLREGHDSSLATVIFPDWSTGTSNHVLGQDRLLATAGTDGAILFWDLGSSIAGDGAVDPSGLFGESVVALEDAMDQVSLDVSSPKILFGIPHDDKPNWLVCSGNTDSALPATLFVADTTNDITAYSIPMR